MSDDWDDGLPTPYYIFKMVYGCMHHLETLNFQMDDLRFIAHVDITSRLTEKMVQVQEWINQPGSGVILRSFSGYSAALATLNETSKTYSKPQLYKILNVLFYWLKRFEDAKI